MMTMITIPSLLMIIECGTIKAHYERERKRAREREREREGAFLGNNMR